MFYQKSIAVRGLSNSMREYTKSSGMFEVFKIELRQRNEILPCFDIETCWSSTFELLRKAFSLHTELNSVENRIPEMEDLFISDTDRKNLK